MKKLPITTKEVLMLVVGTMLMAVSYYFLMMPNGFVLGGVGGLGILLGKLTAYSVGTWLTALNVLLLIIGFIFLG